MTVLRPILSVRELPPALAAVRKDLPSIREFTSPVERPDERNVVAYLGQGISCGAYGDPGLGGDVLQPGQGIASLLPHAPGGTRIGAQLSYTDGQWVWWGALVYYVAKYHLTLPDEFVAHARRQGWRIDPLSIDLDQIDDSALDGVPVKAARRATVRSSR